MVKRGPAEGFSAAENHARKTAFRPARPNLYIQVRRTDEVVYTSAGIRPWKSGRGHCPRLDRQVNAVRRADRAEAAPEIGVG